MCAAFGDQFVLSCDLMAIFGVYISTILYDRSFLFVPDCVFWENVQQQHFVASAAFIDTVL